MTSPVAWLERHQIGLYLVAIAAGGAIGVFLPAAEHVEVAIYPVLGLLLYATFLGVPFASIGAAQRAGGRRCSRSAGL